MNRNTQMMQKVKKYAVKSALTGAALSIAGSMLFGNGNVGLAGYELPAAIPLFISGAGASVVSDVVHDYAFPNTPGPTQSLTNLTSVGIGAGLSAAATIGVMKLVAGLPMDRYLEAGLLGAGSYLAADYIESRYIEPGGKLIF